MSISHFPSQVQENRSSGEGDILYFATERAVIVEDHGYLNRCEYLAVGNDDCGNLELENVQIKGVDKVKYLVVIFNKQRTSRDGVVE